MSFTRSTRLSKSLSLAFCMAVCSYCQACELGSPPVAVADVITLVRADQSDYIVNAHFQKSDYMPMIFAGAWRGNVLLVPGTLLSIYYLHDGQWIMIPPALTESDSSLEKVELTRGPLTVQFGIPRGYVVQFKASAFRVVMDSYANNLCAATPEFEFDKSMRSARIVVPGS